ncbi:hypothetical protein GMPD_25920 [Geomonas paludis]|uniref:Uncharacterized protein n=1 Tax=Geomonas paludis TaxID=2740185 RepID=A0A6V8MYR3_9BACT|nr:hypothetical protein GMPD_25920 [Geomonas paludis]
MHAHDFGGVPEFDVQPLAVVAGQFGLHLFYVADQSYGDAELSGGGYRTFYFNMRGVVAPHYIDSNSHISPRERIPNSHGLGETKS